MDEFEQQIVGLSEGLQKEHEKLERRIANNQEQLDKVQLELDGLNAALRLYREQQGIDVSEDRIEIDEELRERFLDLSHKDAMIALAGDNGGVLVGKDDCKVLVAAGIFKDYQDAQNGFYRTTSRFPAIFQKVKRGVYRVGNDGQPPARNGVDIAATRAEFERTFKSTTD